MACASSKRSDLLGRLAGDEFVAVLPNCGVRQAKSIVERLLAATAPPVVVGGALIHASASVGIAMYPADGRDVLTLLRQADIAMYHAKAEGRGRFSFSRFLLQTANGACRRAI
ncbi:putative signaling protein [Paraburkholderia ultramafica]|uniref:Putative signaling protein n=1 Tax=Paraburkholderia ultramafica TaxID=1544867 RepID=A0A6S7BMC0_9BURK|nr:GGDEF domain-containing protein [Paraburkholderia ultramafica]CAB3793323.1 putative signaling protein [Paraburkholderia ultramafica]